MVSTNGTMMTNGKGVPSKLTSKQKITDEYILQSAVNNQTQAHLAVGLSNNEVLYFDIISKAKTSSFKGHQKSVTGIKFSYDTPKAFYTCSLDGTILVWDHRSGIQPVQTFLDDTDGALKPLLCFDFNSDERFICAGTELLQDDSFLLFWDRRTSKNLGGYWNSHTDEITHVQFHATQNSGLATSSVDGLINLFDLNESLEEDALLNTLNVETSINRFSWGPEDSISCITGTEEYQSWSTEQTSPSLTLTREDLSEKFQCDVDYMIDTFNVGNVSYLACGTNKGFVQLYCHKETGLKQIAILEDGHTDVIRTVCHSQRGTFITGGEDGQLCTWKMSL